MNKARQKKKKTENPNTGSKPRISISKGFAMTSNKDTECIPHNELRGCVCIYGVVQVCVIRRTVTVNVAESVCVGSCSSLQPFVVFWKM